MTSLDRRSMATLIGSSVGALVGVLADGIVLSLNPIVPWWWFFWYLAVLYVAMGAGDRTAGLIFDQRVDKSSSS